MNVWATHAGRLIHECGRSMGSGCGGTIEQGAPILRLQWYTGNRSHQSSYHFDCWVDQAKQYLEFHPYQPKQRGTVGGKRLTLTPEQRLKRRSLLVRGSQLRQARRECVESTLPSMNRLTEAYTQQLNLIRDQLDSIGGVPTTDNWRSYV